MPSNCARHPQPSFRGLLIATSTFATCMAHSVLAQSVTPVEWKHFELAGTVRFDVPSTLILAQIDWVDRNASGRWLITDQVGRQVMLFDDGGGLIASLDPTPCHPGLDFGPMEARFGAEDFIFVLNSGDQWGYRFTADGQCLGSVDREFSSPNSFDIDPTGKLYGDYDWPERAIKEMDPTGATVKELLLPKSRFPNASRRFGHGGLVADGEHIYYAPPVEPEILKFALDGTLLERIYKHSSWFRSPDKDLPPDAASVFAAMKDFVASTPMGPWGLLELTDDLLMIQYGNRERGTGYQVFTKDGVLVAEELGLRHVFMFGNNGRIYRAISLGADSEEELFVPYLEAYEFVAP